MTSPSAKDFLENRQCCREANTKNYRPLSLTAGYGCKALGATLWPSLGRGQAVCLSLPKISDPDTVAYVPASSWGEIRPCWDRNARHCSLHIAVPGCPRRLIHLRWSPSTKES